MHNFYHDSFFVSWLVLELSSYLNVFKKKYYPQKSCLGATAGSKDRTLCGNEPRNERQPYREES